MNELDLAYAAGIIDGEGCISVKNKKIFKPGKMSGVPVIYLGMADKALVYWFKEYFNAGIVNDIGRRKEHYKDQYRWVVEGKQCLKVLALLLPYLRGKKPQALELLKWPFNGPDYKIGQRLSEEIMIERARITSRLKELKRLV